MQNKQAKAPKINNKRSVSLVLSNGTEQKRNFEIHTRRAYKSKGCGKRALRLRKTNKYERRKWVEVDKNE
jgi:hypothetical protein